jgi:hypothetical protein
MAMARKTKNPDYVSPARAALQLLSKLDHALSTAQGHAGSLNVYQSLFPGAKKLGSDVWDDLEKMRWKIRKMLERAERPGGILG